MQFTKRAAQIVDKSSVIIYTDFIANIGPIVCNLHDIGIEAVGYHGEMDATSRCESYPKWNSGEIPMIVATKALGMGIDKPDIRNVIQNNIPENMLACVQELGRVGRDGKQACATILYRRTDFLMQMLGFSITYITKDVAATFLWNILNLGHMYRHTLLVYAEDGYYMTYLIRTSDYIHVKICVSAT